VIDSPIVADVIDPIVDPARRRLQWFPGRPVRDLAGTRRTPAVRHAGGAVSEWHAPECDPKPGGDR